MVRICLGVNCYATVIVRAGVPDHLQCPYCNHRQTRPKNHEFREQWRINRVLTFHL
ncbi:hypothetical protein LINGRAHAP2_LOCUS15601 [Linum grandiflorum]